MPQYGPQYRKYGRKVKKSSQSSGKRRRALGSALPYIIITAIFLTVAGLTLLFLSLFTDVFEKEPDLSELTAVAPSTPIVAMNENLYYIQGSALICEDTKGEVLWSYKTNAPDMRLAAGDSLVCIYNEDSATVLDSEKNLLFTVPSSAFTITGAVVGRGCIALLTEMTDETTNQYIRVFDKSGTELDRAYIKGTDTLRYGLYGEGDNLWYLSLDTTGVYPISNITTASPIQKATTGMISVYDQLISKVLYYKDMLIVSGTKYLNVYDSFGIEQQSTLTYGLEVSDTLETKNDYILALLPQDTLEQQTASAVRILSLGGTDTLIQLPSGVHSVAMANNKVYCCAPERIYVYELSGKFIKSIETHAEIESIEKLSSGLLILKSDRSVYLLAME